jgi:hypothetical protein
MASRRWVVYDRYGNRIYMTEERWEHALDHEDMEEWLLDHVLLTLRTGKRKQEALDPTKYRYSKAFDDLSSDNEHIVLVVKFGITFDSEWQSHENNFF